MAKKKAKKKVAKKKVAKKKVAKKKTAKKKTAKKKKQFGIQLNSCLDYASRSRQDTGFCASL